MTNSKKYHSVNGPLNLQSTDLTFIKQSTYSPFIWN